MDWNQVNWAQVCVIVIAVVVIVVLVAAYVLMRIEVMVAKARQDLTTQQQQFLRSDYARLAGESELHRQELQGLVSEVASMAAVFKEALQREDWNPEEHLAHLARLDAQVGRSPLYP